MPEGNRIISALFLAGAASLVALVAYALAPAGLPDLAARGRSRAEIAVFLPDRASWEALELGARRAADAGWVSITENAPDRLVLTPTKGGRRILLTWHHPAGEWELSDRLEALLRGSNPPEAVIGSSNSALTEAIARTLAASPPGASPPLLIPSASAVSLPDSEAPMRPRTLLGIHPDRTFRFCLNNTHMAALLVDSLTSGPSEHPSRVILISDPADPFSADLAQSCKRALIEKSIKAPLDSITARVDPSLTLGEPTIEEQRLVAPIVAAAQSSTPAQPTWAFLTLQGQAARRLIQAIDQALPQSASANLQVLCGDGIGLSTLEQLTGRVRFSIRCVASGGVLGTSEVPNPSDLGRVEAELISALVTALALSEKSGDDLARSLDRLDLDPGDPGTIGRSLRLDKGERLGDDLGVVFELRPDLAQIQAHLPNPTGWRSYRLGPDRHMHPILGPGTP